MTLDDYFVSNTQFKKEWAFDLNTEKIEDLKSHSRKKVWWRCEKGHVCGRQRSAPKPVRKLLAQ